MTSKHQKILGGNFVIECTNSEFILIEQMFEHYSQLFDKEYEVFYEAFIHSNKLYSSKPPIDLKDLSDFEMEQRLRAEKMAKTINSESFKKRITG